ncbi:unnamed protein product [Meganyctiphanes norvegica]|uniref:Insulin-degrading enzyme n=1 Tax=Meganyctiphanes norvegica TaxID=48144 RepID=A0AAV2SEY3_MEGNR
MDFITSAFRKTKRNDKQISENNRKIIFNEKIRNQVKDCTYKITKPEGDHRQYCALVLQNGLKVVLVSDNTTDKSAVSLDIHVGSMSDPKDIEGIAHLCEHMLLMGSKKFPHESFTKYLSENNGTSNAYTEADHTNYHFDISPNALAEALEKFSFFVLSPLFSQNMLNKEINAVNSEHEKNLKNDYWRLSQIEKSMAKKSHDFSKFGTGNKYTLDVLPKSNNVDVRKVLIDFHSKWYSPNIMALSVLGKESINELQDMVISLFSIIKNKNVNIPIWSDHPFGSEQCGHVSYVVPIKNIHWLTLTFPIPDMHQYYKSDPCHYISHLIKHKGSGSLFSNLKQMGLVNNLIASQKHGAQGFSFFVVQADLTANAMDKIKDIITVFFQYIELLKQEGTKKWIYEECRDLCAMNFRFKDKESPLDYVSILSKHLHYYPPEEILCGAYLLSEYKPDIIDKCIECLRPDNMTYMVVSKDFRDNTNLVEKWYDTRYCLENITGEDIKKWKILIPNDYLHFPPKNDLVPCNFDIICDQQFKSSFPEIIYQCPLTQVWFKQDDEYKLPKANIFIEFFSTFANLDPIHSNLLYLYVQLIKDSLTEYSYVAEHAGLVYIMIDTKYGIKLNIKGYSQKIHVFLENILLCMVSLKLDTSRFDLIKDIYIRKLMNFDLCDPHEQVRFFNLLLLSQQKWSKKELLTTTNELTLSNLQAFIPYFLKFLHIGMLIHGNIGLEQAQNISHRVRDIFKDKANTSPLISSQIKRMRELKLCDNINALYCFVNKVHMSSAVGIYFQCGMQETHQNVALELMCQIFNEPSFNQLRNKEQLGYMVRSYVRHSNGTQGLQIIIQGNKHPQFLDLRIESFLDSMSYYLENLKDDIFIKHKISLAKYRLEKPKNLYTLTNKWWDEIITNQYNFDRDRIEVDYLDTLKKYDIIDFYRTWIHRNAPNRRKLSVYIHSKTSCMNNVFESVTDETKLQQLDNLNNQQIIDDVSVFKESLQLYPLVQPFIMHSNKTKK